MPSTSRSTKSQRGSLVGVSLRPRRMSATAVREVGAAGGSPVSGAEAGGGDAVRLDARVDRARERADGNPVRCQREEREHLPPHERRIPAERRLPPAVRATLSRAA